MFLDILQVAQRYATSPSALYTQRHRGEAPGALAIKVGRRLLWSIEDLKAWEEEKKQDRPTPVAS